MFNSSTSTGLPRAGQPGRNWWRRLFPRTESDNFVFGITAWRMGETVLFIALALLLSRYLAPADMFGIQAQFPWLWIVPAILAMRYGSGIGVVSVLLLLASWFSLSRYAGAAVPALQGSTFPQEYFLGGLVLTLLCGQFSEVWNVRGRRVRAINAYLDERLSTLTKNHFLLRLSHQRLEQDLLSKPLTLRESLERMRALTIGQQIGPDNPLPAAEAFLQILMQSCQLETASVHACGRSKKIAPEATAALGESSELAADDPLLVYCLEEEKLAHLQSASLRHPHHGQSRYMICAPLKNFDDVVFGVLLVEKIPFVALTDDTLQLLSVLIDYYADGIEMSRTSYEIVQEFPGCPPELATDMVRLQRLKANTDIDSALVALVFGASGTGSDMYEQIKRLKRAADAAWAYTDKDRNVLITLLPLAGAAAVEGYLMRVESVMQAQFGSKFLSNYAQVHTAHMGKETPAQMLAGLVKRCAV
ncbi:hypothetical protein D9O50_09690 [Oxalobacteraceae bacterium CAVE-383]|nr:hypothetical protein D9O50_09690 [Oxalobacteraceae bacterium CAVE-383]